MCPYLCYRYTHLCEITSPDPQRKIGRELKNQKINKSSDGGGWRQVHYPATTNFWVPFIKCYPSFSHIPEASKLPGQRLLTGLQCVISREQRVIRSFSHLSTFPEGNVISNAFITCSYCLSSHSFQNSYQFLSGLRCAESQIFFKEMI